MMKPKKKLEVRRQTVRALGAAELAYVIGGESGAAACTTTTYVPAAPAVQTKG